MRAIKISAKHAKAITAELEARFLTPPAIAALDEIRRQLKPHPMSSARKAKATKRASKKEETARIREFVEGRACNSCECGCGRTLFGRGGEMDHFWGRGKEPQSAKNCWFLAPECHRAKTANLPDAETWLRAFFNHAHRHEYWSDAAKARARLEAIQLSQQSAQRTET